MSDEPGTARKLRSHLIVEIILLATLVGYMVFAKGRAVGDDLVFTVVGAILMALASYWTLNTFRDALELVAVKVKRYHH